MWKLLIKQDYNCMEFEFPDIIEAALFVGNFDKVTSHQGVTEYTITKKEGEMNDDNRKACTCSAGIDCTEESI